MANSSVPILFYLQAKTDPDSRSFNKSTPLHIAASMGNYLAAWVLMKAGADLYMQNCTVNKETTDGDDDEPESLKEGCTVFDETDDPVVKHIMYCS